MEIKDKRVEVVKQRDKNYSIMIEKKWYGGYKVCPVNKDDIVSFQYDEVEDPNAPNGKWLNIKGSVTKTGETQEKKNFVPGDQYRSQREKEILLKDELYKKNSEIQNKSIVRQVAFKGGLEAFLYQWKIENESESVKAYTKEGIVDAVKKLTDEFERIIIGD